MFIVTEYAALMDKKNQQQQYKSNFNKIPYLNL